MEKCSFLKKYIQYLGHIVSGDGLKPVPEKLSSIQQMPHPYTPKEVKQFLGLVGYYTKFIPRYADIARPLNALTHKDIDFVWTDICQKSFELLKTMVSEEPILVYPDPSKLYLLFTDASKYASSYFLSIRIIQGKPTELGLFDKEAYAIYITCPLKNWTII